MKQIKIKFIESWAQPLADLLIKRMQEASDEKEFNTLYTIGFYLDLWCVEKGVYLQ